MKPISISAEPIARADAQVTRDREVTRAILLLALLLPFASDARIPRDRSEVRAFRIEHPCPSTGLTRGSCPGYVVDHRIALCVGGLDRRENMQWQTVEDAKAKDKWECSPGWEQRLGQ
jgi:hypothetical protein